MVGLRSDPVAVITGIIISAPPAALWQAVPDLTRGSSPCRLAVVIYIYTHIYAIVSDAPSRHTWNMAGSRRARARELSCVVRKATDAGS